MQITYEQIEQVNKEMTTTPIKGKEYAEVNQRIKAFRKLYPNGKIITEIIKYEQGIVIMHARIFDSENNEIASGLACEKENSTAINKTSFIENCETSAVGRALGMCGLGIDCAVASKDEIEGKESAAEKIEKELETQSIIYTKLRTTLEEMECNFRDAKTNAWIIENANIKAKEEEKIDTQDLQELSLEQLKRLNKIYRGIIAKKKQQEIEARNAEIISKAGELGDFSG